MTTQPSLEQTHIQNNYIRGVELPGQGTEQTGVNESRSSA